MRRFKCNKLFTGEEGVAERLAYSVFFETHTRERGANGVDGLLAANNDKHLKVILHAGPKAQVSSKFKQPT
jgi:hypothetical protein